MWFKKYRLETPFKAIKTSNYEKLILNFSKEVQQTAVFSMLFGVSTTKQSLEKVLASPDDQYPSYLLVLKSNVILARPLRLVLCIFNGTFY